jgi:hypothetical protein
MREAVSVHIDASPDRIWELVSDVTKIGRYSPETFEAKWVEPAFGPAVGAKFRGHVKRNVWGPTYWTTCTVTECEPGRSFFFGVGNGEKPLSVWGYRLESAPEGGTNVTESFELAPTLGLRLYWALLGWSRGKTNRNDMRTTLERIKAEVEAGS